MSGGKEGRERTNHLRDEKRQSNRDRRKESRFMLDDREHDDDENELSCQEHLDEEALRDRGPPAEPRRDVETTGEQGAHDTGRGNAPDELCAEDEDASDGRHAADEAEGKRDLSDSLAWRIHSLRFPRGLG
jgi:hypothetical protein